MGKTKFENWQDFNWFFIISVSIVGITLLHLNTAAGAMEIHQFLRRLYYIPIILAAYRFRLKGGLISSILCGILYAPHLVLYLGTPEIEVINEFMEIILFIAVGSTTGILSQSEYQKRLQLNLQLQKLREMEDEVRVADRLAAVGQLAAGVAHEIRNPLGIIKAAAQLAQDEKVDNPEVSESVAVILTEVERANRVVTELLDFARPRDVMFSSIDIVSIGQDVANIVGQYALQRKVKLTADLPHDAIHLIVDGELVRQALVNLSMNAVQASPENGDVVLKMSRTNHPQGVLIELSDHGIGIPEKDLPRIFDPFFTTREHGTGLGLAIVHRIVRDHSGNIKVQSKPGLGTTISMWLPASNTREG